MASDDQPAPPTLRETGAPPQRPAQGDRPRPSVDSPQSIDSPQPSESAEPDPPGPDQVEPPAPDPVREAARAAKANIESQYAALDVMTEALRLRSTVLASDVRTASRRADAAFATFEPSQLPSEIRSKPSYIGPQDDLGSAMETLARDGAKRLRDSQSGRTIRLRDTDKLRKLMDKPYGEDSIGSVPLGKLIEYLNDAGDARVVRSAPSTPAHEAEAAAARILADIEAGGAAPEATSPQPGAPPATDGTDETAEIADPDADPAHADGDAARATFVAAAVKTLTQRTVAPEESLRYDVPPRADGERVQAGVDTFELRAGPSDVTAYHDFSTLQIAWESAWTELFDDRLKNLGHELYARYVQIKQYANLGDVPDPKMLSIPDIERLLTEVARLGQAITDSPPPRAAAGAVTVHAASPVPGGRPQPPPGVAFTGNEDDDPRGLPPAPPRAGGRLRTPSLDESVRLSALLQQLAMVLNTPYRFKVFKEKSINFGVMVTYRQTWVPLKYQVGDLVSTIPLAPKEARRYTTKSVTKRSRAQKELDDNLRTHRTEQSDTARVDREIVDRAQQKSSFAVMAHESLGGEGYQIDSTQNAGGEQAKQSERAKKDFRESVLRSAQEYRQEHKVEVDTAETWETEGTTFHEIQNPNDELAVTYLLYELQRTYRISERLHQLAPVILVANDVPAPHDINDAWLVAHDWILRRVILDDSFRPALDYLTKSFIGAELNIRLLQSNADAQMQVVQSLHQQVQSQERILDSAEAGVRAAIGDVADATVEKGMANIVSRFFDPLGITGEKDTGVVAAAEGMADYARDTRDRADRERARLYAQLELAISALQTAINKLSAAITQHYDNVAGIDRLTVHIKENILYYMQAIWRHEPADQRYFRLYDLPVPILTPQTQGQNVAMAREAPTAAGALLGQSPRLQATLAMPEVELSTLPLSDVADLDTVLGYKGNYTIFPLRGSHYITTHMMQDYLDVDDELGLRDPDEFSDLTLDEIQTMAAGLRAHAPDEYLAKRDLIRQEIVKRITSGRAEHELVVVPTESLYIEALVGTHPLLEDFKLIHRALDVKKVQAEVRHAELENVRLAARALDGTLEDPDIDKRGAGDRGVTRPAGVAHGNAGTYLGSVSVGGAPYARYRAEPGTWVSASLREQGFDRQYSRAEGYGAYRGAVRSPDGSVLANPDRIRPGQEYLIPLSSQGSPASIAAPAPPPAGPPVTSAEAARATQDRATQDRATQNRSIAPPPAVPPPAAPPDAPGAWRFAPAFTAPRDLRPAIEAFRSAPTALDGLSAMLGGLAAWLRPGDARNPDGSRPSAGERWESTTYFVTIWPLYGAGFGQNTAKWLAGRDIPWSHVKAEKLENMFAVGGLALRGVTAVRQAADLASAVREMSAATGIEQAALGRALRGSEGAASLVEEGAVRAARLTGEEAAGVAAPARRGAGEWNRMSGGPAVDLTDPIIQNALTDASGAPVAASELKGLIATIAQMTSRGWRVAKTQFKYSGNRGLDLFFIGEGENLGRYAFADGKGARGLAELKSVRSAKIIGGMRQGGEAYIGASLATYVERGGTEVALAEEMMRQLRMGNVDSFVGSNTGMLWKLKFFGEADFRASPWTATLLGPP